MTPVTIKVSRSWGGKSAGSVIVWITGVVSAQHFMTIDGPIADVVEQDGVFLIRSFGGRQYLLSPGLFWHDGASNDAGFRNGDLLDSAPPIAAIELSEAFSRRASNASNCPSLMLTSLKHAPAAGDAGL
ncbi:MAG: hypothetical protein H0U59_11555 [Gemmatimonadaceae bacterium]|nr:hypothetical protein [Gemmatimonadaceae bacterium]